MNTIDKLIVLYGERNAGKTTTLKTAFKMLTGCNFPARGDGRVIFKVGDVMVFMATYGDIPHIIDTNFNFFHSATRSNAIIYELDGGKVARIDAERLQQLKPDICITACRIYKDDTPNNIYNRLCEDIMEDMPIAGGVKWIAKQMAEGNRTQQRAVNTDRLTALEIVTEIMNSIK